MNRSFLSLLLISSFLPNVATAQPRLGLRAVEKTVEVDGRTRDYLVFAPRRARGPLPLLFVLHGGGKNARKTSKGRQMEFYCGFNALARTEGFLVCYPEGYEGNWNDGRGVEFIAAHKENVDDVKFLRQVVNAISKEHKLDRSRIFATGISNGAFMSHRLATEASDLFVGIAPLAGGLPVSLAETFKPQHPVSLFVIQGDADPLVPIEGGDVGYRLGKKKRGKFISTDEAVAKYVQLNRISGKPTVSALPDTDPEDGTTTRATIYPAGDNANVQVYVVRNGGHTWPGRAGYLPERLIGKASQDFDASKAIWEFFKSCPPRKRSH